MSDRAKAAILVFVIGFAAGGWTAHRDLAAHVVCIRPALLSTGEPVITMTRTCG